jgi:capsular polysaccharide biosynthesis protein
MSTYDDEIDLRPYVFTLRKKWWLIAIVTVLAAGAGFVYSILQVRSYESSATILLSRSRASLALANQFPTVTEPIDSRSRMDAMLEIAGSDSLLVQTLDDIHQEYPDNGIEREALNSALEITTSGDTIKITATYIDPLYAAAIANAWAQNAVQAINYSYSGEQLPGEIQASLEPARLEYQAAQKDLEEFLKENQVDVLQKQIDETGTLLDELVQDRTWQIAYNVRRKQQMEQVIDQAEALQEQLKDNKGSLAAGLGDALAVLRLFAEAFKEIEIDRGIAASGSTDAGKETIILGSSQPDLVYDVQVSELIGRIESGQVYQQDLERIIEHAEEEKNKAETVLVELAQQSLEVGDDELLIATSDRLRNLQSQLEEETALLNELTSTRDLTWRAYSALAQKETEVRNNLQTSSSVTLASSAVPPIKPTSRGVLRNTAIAGGIGFFLSLIYVIGAEWLQSLGETDLRTQDD